MSKIKYSDIKIGRDRRKIIDVANAILHEYTQEGFVLTLRQLYYQFVARGYISNNLKSYKRLSEIISDGRLAGLIDWESIEDRTRWIRKVASWKSPGDIIKTAASQYHRNLWDNQECRPEVWIEKDALTGVIEGICNEWDIPFFPCRGNISQSEAWRAGLRINGYIQEGKRPVIFHLGDHDPSGIDMTRDNKVRSDLFVGRSVEIVRLALNMNQVEELSLPPNPVKMSDSKTSGYINRFGTDECWELDALPPSYIVNMLRDSFEDIVDLETFDNDKEQTEKERKSLTLVSDNYLDTVRRLSRIGKWNGEV